MDTSYDFQLERIPLFSGLPPTALESIRSLLSLIDVNEGDALIREGDYNDCCIFILVDGEASVCKRALNNSGLAATEYEIATLKTNDIVGEMSLLDGQPVSATIKAKTPLKVAILNLSETERRSPSWKVRNLIVTELGRCLAGRLRRSNEQNAEMLRRSAEFARYRNALGLVLTAALSLLSFYTLSLSAIPSIQDLFELNFAATPIIILVFAVVFWLVIRSSHFPPAFFGVRLDNWRPALGFSIMASLGFLFVGVLAKWILIVTMPGFQDLALVSVADIRVAGKQVPVSQWYLLVLAVYIVLTPLQEFVARCGVQAPLYAFLEGSELKRRTWSILVSNLVFSAAHAHTNLAFALAAFLPGIYWGWIFARTNSLLAASVSHIIVGGAGIFLFGIEDLISKLFL